MKLKKIILFSLCFVILGFYSVMSTVAVSASYLPPTYPSMPARPYKWTGFFDDLQLSPEPKEQLIYGLDMSIFDIGFGNWSISSPDWQEVQVTQNPNQPFEFYLYEVGEFIHSRVINFEYYPHTWYYNPFVSVPQDDSYSFTVSLAPLDTSHTIRAFYRNSAENGIYNEIKASPELNIPLQRLEITFIYRTQQWLNNANDRFQVAITGWFGGSYPEFTKTINIKENYTYGFYYVYESNDYQLGYDNGWSNGYNSGYNSGYNDGYNDGLSGTLSPNWFTSFLDSVFEILNIEIFPNVKLIYLLFIPVGLGILALIFRLVRG